MWALTAEKAAALAAAAAAAADRLAGLRETTAAALWVADLDALDVAVGDYLADSDADDEASWTEPPLPTVGAPPPRTGAAGGRARKARK